MNTLIIVFRTKGSSIVGLGHLRRCMTLAQVLEKEGTMIYFVVNRDEEAQRLLSQQGFQYIGVDGKEEQNLSETLALVKRVGAAGLVVDTYDIDGHCLSRIQGPKVIVIDDMADRPLAVDMVINGAARAEDLNYQTSSGTALLLGIQYALLRDSFSQKPYRLHPEGIKRVLISVGGRDPFGLTLRLMNWTLETLNGVKQDVIVGPFFGKAYEQKIDRMAEENGQLTLHHNPENLRNLMLGCDLAVTGGGQTTYELAATGTPTIAIRLADNQTRNVMGLSEQGTLEWIGDLEDHNLQEKFKTSLLRLSDDRGWREKMSLSGRLLVDGSGAIRASKEILELCVKSC